MDEDLAALQDQWAQAGGTAGLAAFRLVRVTIDSICIALSPVWWTLEELDARRLSRDAARTTRRAAVIAAAARASHAPR